MNAASGFIGQHAKLATQGQQRDAPESCTA